MIIKKTYLQEESGNVNSLEGALEAAVRERKETFILVFNKFIEAMKEKFNKNSQEDLLASTWWRWVAGNMRETGRYVT